METPLELDFMAVSSMGVEPLPRLSAKDLTTDIAGRDADRREIIDREYSHNKEMLNSRSPSSVNIVTLLDKPQRRGAITNAPALSSGRIVVGTACTTPRNIAICRILACSNAAFTRNRAPCRRKERWRNYVEGKDSPRGNE
ncbi:MAG: hypothetical protein ACLS4Z_10905 [Christensenellaceae bacterium]